MYNNYPVNQPDPDIYSASVSRLQDDLRHLSYHDEDIKSVAIDGIFGDETRDSLLSFQRKYGLPATGVADLETWERLREVSDASRAFYSPPTPIRIFPRFPTGYYWDGKSSPIHIAILQYVLDELSREYSHGEIPQTGIYDEATVSAVMDFQTKNGLHPTGVVDRTTWNELARQYNNTVDSNR